MNEQNNGTQGQKHPLALSPAILILNIILAVLGAIIGMELIVRVGISTNTSIVGEMCIRDSHCSAFDGSMGWQSACM